MSAHSAEFRRCLIEVDTMGVRALWAHVSPHLPQPQTEEETLVTIHHARTQAQSVPPKLRFYSHRWLLDRGLPSGLPDALKPRAERMYPKVADAVGISVSSRSPERAELARATQKAMSDAVAEMYADGNRDPVLVKIRMGEARDKILRTA